MILKNTTTKTRVLFRRYLISSLLIKGCYEENLLVKVILKLQFAEMAQEP